MVSLRAEERTIPEIEAKMKLVGGDMVKIEYLENCLKQPLPNDVKRFCFIKLAELYASKLMFKPAAKNMDFAGECATTYKDKVSYFMKEIEYLMKDEDYLFVEKAFKKALAASTTSEKKTLVVQLKRTFITRAEEYEKRGKRNSAIKVYEKFCEMHSTTQEERVEIMKRLADLYSKTGKIREAMKTESWIKNPPAPQKKQDEGHDIKVVSFEELGIGSLD
jgi:tetratricopeptide (TPR) repeat protein